MLERGLLLQFAYFIHIQVHRYRLFFILYLSRKIFDDLEFNPLCHNLVTYFKILISFCIFLLKWFDIFYDLIILVQKYVLGRPIAITRTLMFAVAITCCFCFVISVLKVIKKREKLKCQQSIYRAN